MYIYYNKEDHILSKTILRCLEVVEVAHRGSTAGGRVVRLKLPQSPLGLFLLLQTRLGQLGVLATQGAYQYGP